jgi:hypothetical protein
MHHHRNGSPPRSGPEPSSPEFRAQRIVLLELVVDPPAAGDHLDDLRARLGLPRETVEPAAIALQLAGLAERRGDIVRCTFAATYFEYLWPVRP